MRLYIPEISDQIRLTTDWTFGLYNEDRNQTLMEIINDTRDISYSFKGPEKFFSVPCTIPKGEILRIDRVYIRKGGSEYSSISFFWAGKRTNSRIVEHISHEHRQFDIPREIRYEVKVPSRPVRFWAKLDDVNNIEFEKV